MPMVNNEEAQRVAAWDAAMSVVTAPTPAVQWLENTGPVLEKLRCERCGGTGEVTLFGVPNGIGFEMDADEQPCPECREGA